MTPFPLDRPPRRPLAADPLTIGLVNNMPDAALKSTERQFRELLARAAGGAPVALRVFSFPELPRSPEGRRHVDAHHRPIDDLWHAEIDGLIVTGAAPVAPRLEDEPCWPTLTRLVDWAGRRTRSTVFSCLAAHAAVRHLDGIARRPLAAKLSGVFDCAPVADHPLLAAMPARWTAPHSRYNELPEAALLACGYRLLSRSTAAGADVFIKRDRSLFVFLQGHPEYDAGALGREYRRDVREFVAGTRERYPELPENYFTPEAAAKMRAFRQTAAHRTAPPLPESFLPLPTAVAPWQNPATTLFANWIDLLRAPYRQPSTGWTSLHLPAIGRETLPQLSSDAAPK